MRVQVSYIKWVAFALLIVMSVSGCSFFEGKGSAGPTSPAADPSLMSNFYAGPGNGNRFGIYKQHGELMVDVLTGQFLLTYTTLLGTFHVVFEATAPTVVIIGITEGDDVIQAIEKPEITQGEVLLKAKLIRRCSCD